MAGAGARRDVLCRAKVNLTLHVGAPIPDGERWAGYHPVESVVVFADFGDTLGFTPAEQTTLTIEGDFAEGLTAESDNLVMQAMDAVGVPPQSVTLTKRLPIASGLGGGSANAAGVLRAFDPRGHFNDVALGADVPVCRLSRTALMEGIGERVRPLPGLGRMDAVLVNPGVAVSTGAIFKAYDLVQRPAEPDRTQTYGSLIERARSGRNDLQNAAIVQAPVIAEVLTALKASADCDLARMSGSGATCFGLYRSQAAAQAAARDLEVRGWWAVACRLGDPD